MTKPTLCPTPGSEVYFHDAYSGGVFTVYENYAKQVTVMYGGFGIGGYVEWALGRFTDTGHYELYVTTALFMGKAENAVPPALSQAAKECALSYLAAKQMKDPVA